MESPFKTLIKEITTLIKELESLKKSVPNLVSTKTHLKLQATGWLSSTSKKAKKVAENPIAILLKKITADKDLSKATILYLTSVIDHAAGLSKDTLKMMEVIYPNLTDKEKDAVLVFGYDVLQKGLVAKEMIKSVL